MKRYTLPLLVSLIVLNVTAPCKAADQAGLDLFEKKIRPILVRECYLCHSQEAVQTNKLKGGLFLDSAGGLRKGGDSGPVVVEGKPKESKLIKALRYSGAVKMPPRGQLPDSVVADFEKWIALGAPDPRKDEGGSGKPRTIDIEAGRKHWAYQSVRGVTVPQVKNTTWSLNTVDRFILTRLEAEKLNPAKDADRVTLVRRLYFDLIGLAPTPDEIDAFVKDNGPDAYERLVERLLASPHFGERWGRHWLDVARFAESIVLRGFILKDAWRYRDYVIESFNADRRFDRFMGEQVAGDLMPFATLDDRRRQMTGTTFLGLGNTNLEEQDKKQLRMDVVDEQLETIGKAFLGQTIGCARCHDHKFDPIPTRDYYALAGILRSTKTLEHANVSKWLEIPLPVEPAHEEVLKKHETLVAALQLKIKEAKGTLAKNEKPIKGSGIVDVKDLPGIVLDDTKAKKVGAWKDSQFSGSYIGTGYLHDENTGKGEKTLTFVPDLPHAGKYEIRLAYVPGTNRATNVPVHIFGADGEKNIEVNQQDAPPIDGRFVSLGIHRFENNGQHFVLIGNEETKGHVIVDAIQFLPVDEKEAQGSGSKASGSASSAERVKQLEEELQKLIEAGPKRETVISVIEEKDAEDTHVHVRGSVHNLGEKAPRGFLRVVTVEKTPVMPAKQSGRLQLADWLALPDNPLPSRVMANRIWHWLFGSGIVRTTDNFGTTGEDPSHPELLDYLAARLVEQEWSVKALVREIVLSHTYRQSSLDPRGAEIDPENRLVGRMNRRRLDAECIRDAMLQTGGNLQLAMYGPTFKANLAADYNYKHTDTRRSVYSPVFRNSLTELLEVFDVADPSVTTGRRNVSTVAPQALFMLNHPFVHAQSLSAAQRLLAETSTDDSKRITLAYRTTLGREPTTEELKKALKFLNQTPSKKADAVEPWAQLFHALFASVDFRYTE